MNYDRTKLTVDEQVSELAAILASGVTRWHQQQRRFAGIQNPPDFATGRLEVPPTTVLSVTNPVNGPENQRQGAPA